MGNVLLVSYYVPPRFGIATTRTRQLIAHLPKYGWNVTAVTAHLEGAAADVVQTPYLDIRGSIKRAIGLRGATTHEALGATLSAYDAKRSMRQRVVEAAFHLTNYPDAQAGWYFSGTKVVRSLIASGKFDVVLSSAPPFTTNCMIASALRGVRRIPWVADFRDLWMGNDLYSTSAFRRFFDARLERWSLRGASALTTVSEPLAEILRKRYPRIPVYAIPNAFDAAEWEKVPFEAEDRCTFLYAGELSSGRRNPRPLFRVMRTLIDNRKVRPNELRVELYSGREPWLEQMIAEYNLGEIVHIHGLVSRDIVLPAERRADRLLVILWTGIGTEGILPGKLFEYLGARRRIIALGGPPQSAVDGVLAESGAGKRYNDDSALATEIFDAVNQHRNEQIQTIDINSLQLYEASMLARRFAIALTSATQGLSR